ncbi:hypothetical protein SprV_0100364900 [Sparganum proliferum]
MTLVIRLRCSTCDVSQITYLDAVLLFTSIPPDLTRDDLRKWLEENYDETKKPLKIDHLQQLFAFCQQTLFIFNDRTFQQIKGTPMGSLISSLVAEVVLQELEEVVFNRYEPVFWRRYVDDMFVIIEKSRTTDFQDLLNGIFPDIQFTREEKYAEQSPYLDFPVTCGRNGELSTTVYRKEDSTIRVLNYHSNHPMAHRRGCVRTLFQRVKRITVNRRDEYENCGIFETNWQGMDTQTASSAATSASTHGEQTEESHPILYIKNVLEATKRITAEFGVELIVCQECVEERGWCRSGHLAADQVDKRLFEDVAGVSGIEVHIWTLKA